MKVNVLGSLTVSYSGTNIAPSATKPRTVLALLAVRANTVVAIDELLHELWGENAPRSARAIVQTYIMHLRKLVTAAAGGGDCATAKRVVVTRPGGYMLNVDEAEVDVWKFDELATAGHRGVESGDLELASQRFSEALALWRGRPLLDVQTGPFLTSEVKRLEEAHLNVLDRKFDVDLRLSRHYEIIGELAGLVARHPTHEGLCAHLMLALYRSGRRPEALEVYRKLHTRMVEEQALEPSPALRRLHRSMLVSDRAAGSTDVWSGDLGRDRWQAKGRFTGISPELASIPWDVSKHGRSRPDGVSPLTSTS